MREIKTEKERKEDDEHRQIHKPLVRTLCK